MRFARLLGLVVAYTALEVGEQALGAVGAAMDAGEDLAVGVLLAALRWVG